MIIYKPIVKCECFCETRKSMCNPYSKNEVSFNRDECHTNTPNSYKNNCNNKDEPKRYIDPLLPAQKGKTKEEKEKEAKKQKESEERREKQRKERLSNLNYKSITSNNFNTPSPPSPPAVNT
jgi:hypothetical protein